MAPVEALFVASPLGFGGLHYDINFFAMRQSYRKVIKETVTTNSMRPYYSAWMVLGVFILCGCFNITIVEFTCMAT